MLLKNNENNHKIPMFCRKLLPKFVKKLGEFYKFGLSRTAVNFINVKRANFLYEFFDKAKT